MVCAMWVEQMSLPENRPAANPRRCTGIFQSVFSAEPHAVRNVLRAAVARFAPKISEGEAGALELLLAELLNNIVEHGYAYGQAGTISLSILCDRRGLSCSLIDDGVPLPPHCLHPPDLPDTGVATENMPEGGFGWFLIHDLARDLRYRREAGQNLLEFRLPLSAPET